jgi:hypothetical protein
MVTLTLSRAPLRSHFSATRWRTTYRWWFPLTVYVLARLVDVVFILIAARHQIGLPERHTGLGSPGYRSVASNWDGLWYFSIAREGYPTTLPHDASGRILQNQWGFYPAYPLMVGAVMRLSGLSFVVVAPILSFLLGAAAVTVMFRLINQCAGRFAASATVLLVCTSMAAPAMQIAYTESLALLLLCTALLLLRSRRYGWLVPVVVMLALTRPVALAFAPVVVVHGISRYRRRSVDPFARLERVWVLALAFLSVAVTGLWPAIAAVATGDPRAYTRTMSAWRLTDKLSILTEWPAFAWEQGGSLGLATLLVIIALVLVIVLRGASAWGPEVRAWAGFYPLYVLLATTPGTSSFRHLFLAFPLVWPFPDEVNTAADRRRRIALVAFLAIVGLLLQWFWVSQFLVVTAPGKRPTP